jgi:hypothetical protein
LARSLDETTRLTPADWLALGGTRLLITEHAHAPSHVASLFDVTDGIARHQSTVDPCSTIDPSAAG